MTDCALEMSCTHSAPPSLPPPSLPLSLPPQFRRGAAALSPPRLPVPAPPPVFGLQVSSGKLVSEEPDGAPLVTQFRQWLGGSLDKGTLTTDARLPPGWIVLPHSCRKIRGSEGCAARARGVSRFEINSTFDVCSRGRTNVNLVQLLEHLAVRPQELRVSGGREFFRGGRMRGGEGEVKVLGWGDGLVGYELRVWCCE